MMPASRQPELKLGYKTHQGLDSDECVSALQKHIRRGEERAAMEFACELLHSDKQSFSRLCNRLQIISHEDVGLADRYAVIFVRLACEQAREFYNLEKIGECRMVIGNAIRLLCRANKSREGDHFQAAIGLPNLLHERKPTVPDFAIDKHTRRGKARGRGLDHFRKEGAKLVPPAKSDGYEDEAYQVWARQEERNKAARVKPMDVDNDD